MHYAIFNPSLIIWGHFLSCGRNKTRIYKQVQQIDKKDTVLMVLYIQLGTAHSMLDIKYCICERIKDVPLASRFSDIDDLINCVLFDLSVLGLR